jgi:hypothetical protein
MSWDLVKMDGVFLIQDIGNFDPPIRFAVGIGSPQHRIFSYFPIGSDGSIGVQDYFPANSTMMRTLNKPPAELPELERTIKKGEFEVEAQSFRPQKFSFHKSGVSNAKSQRGERFPGDYDTHSIPFADIQDTIRLCYIYPAAYHRYPQCSENDNKHHNVFDLSEAFSTMPSMIEMRLARGGFDIEHRLKGSYRGFAAFRDVATLRKFDIAIYTILRRSPNVRFPSHHAFICERYQT